MQFRLGEQGVGASVFIPKYFFHHFARNRFSVTFNQSNRRVAGIGNHLSAKGKHGNFLKKMTDAREIQS